MLLLVKCWSFSQKYDKKLQNCIFFFFYCVFFIIFLEITPQMICRNYSSKTYIKSILFECSNALNEAIFPKTANFGICAIAVRFLCFSRETHLILIVYNGQIEIHCWHHFKFYLSLWLINLASMKHPFLCVPFIIFFAQSLEILWM